MKKLITLMALVGLMASSAGIVSARGLEVETEANLNVRSGDQMELNHQSNNQVKVDDRGELRNIGGLGLRSTANGRVSFVGVVASNSSTGLTLNNSNGWTLNLSNAKFARKGATSTLSSFQVGDKVLITGNASSSTHIITVANVRFLENNNIQKVNKNGTASNVTSNGFTLSSGNKDYVVQTNSSTTLNASSTFSISNIVNGMRVKVKGMLNKLTSVITAMNIKVRTNATTTASTTAR